MRLDDVTRVLDEIAPTRWAEDWDNVGLLVGDPGQAVSHTLLAIDYTEAVAAEAERLGCELVVAYHPPIFRPLERITAPSPIYHAIRRGLALYSPHTALDVAAGGTNDLLADALGLEERQALRPSERPEVPGMGRLGRLPPTPRPVLFGRIRAALGVERLLIAGPTEGEVRRAAVCAGACGDLIERALAEGVDLYLTGELRHHDALRAAQAGMTVVCALHSNSERAVLGRVAERLRERLAGLRVSVSTEDRDPFQIA